MAEWIVDPLHHTEKHLFGKKKRLGLIKGGPSKMSKPKRR